MKTSIVPHNRVIKHVLVGTLLTIGMVLAVESVLRCLSLFDSFRPTNADHPVDSFAYVDQTGLLRLQPNVVADSRRCLARSWGAKNEIHIGDLGLRDFNHGSYRKLGTLFLGDSIVMSASLDTEDTFVHQVESKCRESDSQFQAINAGLVDSGLEDHIERLKYYLPILQPKTVVIGLFLNDSQPAQRSLAEALAMPNWYTVLSRHSLFARQLHPLAIAVKLRSHPQLAQRFGWIRSYLEWYPITTTKQLRELVSLAEYDWGAAWRTDNWKHLGEELAKAKELVESGSANLVVALFPTDPQVTVQPLDDFVRAPQIFFEQQCSALGLHCIDLLPTFRAYPDSRELFCDQCHLTAQASRVVSQVLSQELCPVQ